MSDSSLSSPSGSTVNSKEAQAAFASLLHKASYLSNTDLALLNDAYHFADAAHDGQFRSSGEPYITHPIAVASICTEWKLDIHSLVAALLHDTIEDSSISKEDVIGKFGTVTAEIVDGVTKLDKVQFNSREEGQAESFRKMMLAMARDIRVILLKLADRTHNMRTLEGLRPEKQRRIGRETLEIYAPIANLLGINLLYRELQDLAFRSIWPWRAKTLTKALDNSKNLRTDMFQQILTNISQALKQASITPEIATWQKNLYSIYCKMEERQLTYAQVTDHFNLRVMVKSHDDCYRVLGILHQLYRPFMNRFKDYIAIPKINGYQSLHTSLIGPANTTIDIQIRTEQMNRVAEHGVTSHWLYGHDDGGSDHMDTKWLQPLLEIQKSTHDSFEFFEHVKVDLHPNSIYVFTPQSRIISLPQGATPVDFAYAIHSDVGDHCVAAYINGERASLRTVLSNGDVIEIVINPSTHPNPDWLTFVRTGRARAKIRAYIKTLEESAGIIIGEKILMQSLRAEGIAPLPPYEDDYISIWDKLVRHAGYTSRNELLIDIAQGKRTPQLLAKQMVKLLAEKGIRPDLLLLSAGHYVGDEQTHKPAPLLLNGTEESSIKYAKCCNPIPGDSIVGYLEHNEGLKIHIADCAVLAQLMKKNPERRINVGWSDEPQRLFEAGVWVTTSTRLGMLARITRSLANIGVDIVRIDMTDGALNAPSTFRIVINVRDRQHLAAAIKALRREPVILKAGRIKPVPQPL